MEKNEYNSKTEQMLELMERGAYKKAAQLADSIEWNKVRNISMLSSASEIYEQNDEPKKSYKMLNIAYQRSDGSRKIIYRLCTLALKIGNLDEALDFYDDFMEIAPKDPSQYILRYQILRARKAPIEQQIEALENYKNAEYIEEWAYELARLYQEAGMITECISECDDLILWFSEGKHVYQAMELKMKHKPLTDAQQEKYNRRFETSPDEEELIPIRAGREQVGQKSRPGKKGAGKPRSLKERLEAQLGETVKSFMEEDAKLKNKEKPEEEQSVESTLLEETTVFEEPILPEEFLLSEEVSPPKEDVEEASGGIGMMMDLGQALQSVLGASGEEELAGYTLDTGSMEEAIEAIESVADSSSAGGTAKEISSREPSPGTTQEGEASSQVDGQLSIEDILQSITSMIDETPEGPSVDIVEKPVDLVKGQEEPIKELTEEPKKVPVVELAEESKKVPVIELAEEPKKVSVEELAEEPKKVLAEELAEEPKKVPVRELTEELKKMPIEELAEEPKKTAKKELVKKPKKVPTKELTEESIKIPIKELAEESTKEPAVELEKELLEDLLEEPTGEYLEELIEVPAKELLEELIEVPTETGTVSPETIPVNNKKIREKAKRKPPRKKGAAPKRRKPSEIREEVREIELPEELEAEIEKDFQEEVEEETMILEEDAEEIRLSKEEAPPAKKRKPKEEKKMKRRRKPSVSDMIHEEFKLQPEHLEEEDERFIKTEKTDKEAGDSIRSKSTAPLSRKETAKLHATGKTSPMPYDEISNALSLDDTGFTVQGRYDLESQSGKGTRAGLTEEQKKLFSYFVPVRGMSEQLVEVLEHDRRCKSRNGTSKTGNLLVMGRKGSGKTVLAVDIVKAIQKQRKRRPGKVAILTGDALNKKRINDIIGKLHGGALIIEKAGKMNEKTVARLNMALEQETGELLVVLEEQRKPLDRLLSINRDFKKKFTSRIEVPVFENDDLVTFGQTYAQENGYKIDEMGILALYSKIDNRQREDHAVTVAEVKDMMDAAIDYSQRASAKLLVKRVLGKNTDDADRIILSEKDFA